LFVGRARGQLRSYFLFEPYKFGPVRARIVWYDGSYRTTAAFLLYVTSRDRKSNVIALNSMLREEKWQIVGTGCQMALRDCGTVRLER
jgi:hypothetical protein